MRGVVWLRVIWIEYDLEWQWQQREQNKQKSNNINTIQHDTNTNNNQTTHSSVSSALANDNRSFKLSLTPNEVNVNRSNRRWYSSLRRNAAYRSARRAYTCANVFQKIKIGLIGSVFWNLFRSNRKIEKGSCFLLRRELHQTTNVRLVH